MSKLLRGLSKKKKEFVIILTDLRLTIPSQTEQFVKLRLDCTRGDRKKEFVRASTPARPEPLIS